MSAFRLENKPLTTSQVFGRGWEIFIASFWSAMPFSFLLALLGAPGFFLQSNNANSSSTESTVQISQQTAEIPTAIWILIGVVVVLAIMVSLMVFLGIYGGLIKQLDATAKGKQKLNFIEALFAGFSKTPTLIGVTVPTFIAIFIGTLLFFVPGIYLLVILFFVVLLPLVENLGIADSFKESVRLVSGFWWHTFLSIVILCLITGLYHFLVTQLIWILVPNGNFITEPMTGTAIASIIILIIAQTLVLPFIYSCMLSIMYDLQSRKALKNV